MTTPRRLVALPLLAAGALAAGAGQAAAAQSDVPSCDAQVLSRPFLPFLDPLAYTPVGDRGFESGAGDWTLSGGARVVDGLNEPWSVGGGGDRHALTLPPGGVAVSPQMCVGLGHPTIRFFARGHASLLAGLTTSRLAVTVSGTGPLGLQLTAPVLAVTIPGGWGVTLPTPFLTNLGALLAPGGTTAVSFRFAAQGATWDLDDVYLDPFKAR
jgi:hypothetical protein